MAILLWITTAILTFHATQSYILLTANLEDVQAIAKQISNSPVADQLNKIWRRAADQFATHLQQPVKPQPKSYARSNFEDGTRQQGSGYLQQGSGFQHQGSGFQQQGSRYPQMRSFEDQDSHNQRRGFQEEARRNRDDEELVALGRNASRYLKSIRKIFEKD